MATFEERARAIVATAAQIAKLQGAQLEVIILEQSVPSLLESGYDNWNGGTSLYTLMLEVPIPTYAAIESQRDELEKSIQQRVSQLIRTEAGNRIAEVVVSPVLAESSKPTEPESEPGGEQEELPSFWQPGFFRLFLSHVSEHKNAAHKLKEALASFQIVAFVAHDDVEPSREWQAEIERALRTMDALAAMLAEGFVASRWCDQEVGIAMGRGKLVLPLKGSSDPHGFMGKFQALNVQNLDAATAAERVFDILMANPLSSERMTEALVDRLANATSFEKAKRSMTLLERAQKLNPVQVARVMRACDENSQVRDAWGVPDRIRNLVQRSGLSATQQFS